ncbi:unnamed protein product [Darwinula stevensoni]|uniref:28S ribosomal protein S18b, mitochondrial n=1 Tax=Darwinula stevensoni TaxID=69355 RepID=A0A7R8X3Z8_9CRUS|nr:unnamed protein product [Darwinula stevensoni]CAG0884927.1 unnamed protein product [Darwinula stevensoni]
MHDSSKDRTVQIPVETSMRYMTSEAYKETYGDHLVWQLYRRNFKGQFPPKRTRQTCIRKGVIATGNPCPICRDEYLVLDYRNIKLLHQFLCPHTGQILRYSTEPLGRNPRQGTQLLRTQVYQDQVLHQVRLGTWPSWGMQVYVQVVQETSLEDSHLPLEEASFLEAPSFLQVPLGVVEELVGSRQLPLASHQKFILGSLCSCLILLKMVLFLNLHLQLLHFLLFLLLLLVHFLFLMEICDWPSNIHKESMTGMQQTTCEEEWAHLLYMKLFLGGRLPRHSKYLPQHGERTSSMYHSPGKGIRYSPF